MMSLKVDWVATGMFALGTIIALFNLLVKDTSGDTGLHRFDWNSTMPSRSLDGQSAMENAIIKV